MLILYFNMGVRLNKVLGELNIGIQTAIDFLKEKPELGEIKDDITSNSKITDEQYEALLVEFKRDKEIFDSAHTIFPPRVHYREELEEDKPQTFTPLGRIDIADKISHSADVISDCDQMLSENQADDKYHNEYTILFLNSYKEALNAYRKKKWNDWILKGRQSIEIFCKYYICWLCGEDKVKAKNILSGKCDFENEIPQRDRATPQGRRLITLIYQAYENQLDRFISDHKMYSAYVTFSEFIHNSTSLSADKTTPLQGVLERLYSIYMWTTSKNYSDINGGKQIIRLTHSSIKFISSNKETRLIRLSLVKIKKGHEGDYVLVIEGKHNYVLDRDYTRTYDENALRDLLQHDWIVLRQKRNKFVDIDFDNTKLKEEIQWGISQLKKDDEECSNDLDLLYRKIETLKELGNRLPEVEDFTNHYYVIKRLQPVVPVFIDNKKWFVLLDKITIEDTNFLWGDDARIHIEGLDHNNEYVKKNIDVRISHNKSEKIKRINEHNFYSLDLVQVSNKYHLLINYVNGNL